MSQEESIKNILNNKKYDLCYNDNHDCNIVELLNEVKAFGCIPKYNSWKKLFSHLTTGRYDTLIKNLNALKIILELIDEKYTPNDKELKKIYDCIQYNYEESDNIKSEMYLQICSKIGICNYNHFIFLLETNNKKPINKFTTHILDYFNKEKNKESKSDYDHKRSKIFLNIIDNSNLKSILTNDVIDKIIYKFDFDYEFSYDFHQINTFINDKIELENDTDSDSDNKLKKKSKLKKSKLKKSISSEDENIEIEQKKETCTLNKYLKFHLSCILLINHIF
jgi:hypothetical protein